MNVELLEELSGKIWHVCMSGGGAGGIIEVGALDRLEELGVMMGSFSGTSTGSLNSAGMGFLGLDKLKEIWNSLTRNDQIFKSNWFVKRPRDGWQIGPIIGDALMNSEPLRKLLTEALPKDGTKPARPCSVTYIDLAGGRREARGGDDKFIEATLASSSVPMWTNPINGTWVDGGVQDITPLKGAIEAGHENIIVLLAGGWYETDQIRTFKHTPSEFWMKWAHRFRWCGWMRRKLEGIARKWLLGFAIAQAAVDQLVSQNYMADIRTCLDRNELGKYTGKYKHINILVFAPQGRETPTNKFDDPEMRQRDFQRGREMVDRGPVLRSSK